MNTPPSHPIRLPGHLKAAWLRLSRVERAGLASSAALACGLLLALAQTCQASVQRGERLRAAQQHASTAIPAHPLAASASTADA